MPFKFYYINKNLLGIELKYIVTKEFLVIIYAINKFRHYITDYPLFVHTIQELNI